MSALPKPLAGIVVAAALVLGACRQTPRALVWDLVAEAEVARQIQADGVRSYVSPPATVYSVRWRGRQAGGRPRLVSNAILEWQELLPREAVLDVQRPEWGSGDVQVTLNRTPLGRFSLDRARGFSTVSLPPEAQRIGPNRLRLSFLGGPADGPPPPAGPPVRLHGVGVRRPGRGGPPRLVDARPGLDGDPALTLAAGTGLEYALVVPEEAELRFTPRGGNETAVPVLFRVTLTVEGAPSRDLLTVVVEPGDTPSEVRVPLGGEAGSPALLGLFVSGPDASTGEWAAPRVLGRPDPPPSATASPARLEGLRRRLRGAGVLLIVLDAAAARHVGCYGYERDTTPEIDRLADEGVLFEQAYTPASYTGVAIASLWTSQHPEQHHHGVSPRDQLPTHRVVLPELLREEGIRPVAFYGNMVAGEVAGLARGFTQVHPLFLTSKEGTGGAAARESSLTRIVASIAERAGEPSLTYLHYREPHFPYDPPPPFDTRFGPDAPLPARAMRDASWIHEVIDGRVQPTAPELAHLVRAYDGNLAAVDHEIGHLRRRLEAAGCWDDLVVIVTADHGETLFEHGQLFHASQVYEESVRVPLVLRLPGETGPKRIAEPVDLLDLGATLADIFGVVDAARGHFEGRSLLPSFRGAPLEPRALVTRTLAERPTYSLYDGRLKVIHDPNWGHSELYDLHKDRGEQHDLSRERPVTTELFRQSLYRWIRDLDRGEPARKGQPVVTPETEKALRALGYVQ